MFIAFCTSTNNDNYSQRSFHQHRPVSFREIGKICLVSIYCMEINIIHQKDARKNGLF